ncbi:putative oxidoreductase [Armadillidium vulgare]|nr:putative oxidoreductase [Armadillidium vulgare]
MADVYTNAEKHVVLQNNVKMPLLGLGTSHNGGYNHDAVVHALKNCGYRHIDTAKRYGCESYIAEAIKESGVNRRDIFLATKCWPTDYGSEKTKIAAKGSCGRLGTDYLEKVICIFFHWPEVPSGHDRKTLINEAWRTLELLYDEGMFRAIGVSNFFEEHLESLLEDCSITPHVNQCEFHPFNNPLELRQMCEENKIQFEGYSPLAKGKVLSSSFVTELSEDIGKTPSQILIRWSIQNNVPTIPKSTKCERIEENSKGYSPLANGTIFSEPLIRDMAAKVGKSCSQIVLRWNVQARIVCIPKSTKEERVEENAKIFDFELSPDDMELLNSIPRCLTVIDKSSIQEKIDNPKPDGYKLEFVKLPPQSVSFH